MPNRLKYLLCPLLFCAFALAEPLDYTANVSGKARNASVDAFQSDNQPYVSLSKLLHQLGGSTRESPGKLTMDLNGKSAVVSLNGTMVSTSSASFSLHFPVKEADGGPYVAVEDLERLFDQGFGASIQRGKTAPEPEPAPTPAAATTPEKTGSPDAEENMGLLENVSTPAPAVAPTTETPPAPGTPATAPVPATPSGTFVVVLDPGHGGNDPGIAVGDHSEKDIALKIALATEKALADAKGLKVVLTRKEDKDLNTAERADVVSQMKPALLISLHTGGSPSPAAHGMQIFVQTSAAGIAHATGSAMSGESKYQAERAEKLLVEKTGATSRGVQEAPLRLLSSVNVPAMLIELGMLTSPADESLLVSAEYQQKIAGALAALIQDASARAGGAKPAEAK